MSSLSLATSFAFQRDCDCQVEGFDETGKPLERITKSEQLQAGEPKIRHQRFAKSLVES